MKTKHLFIVIFTALMASVCWTASDFFLRSDEMPTVASSFIFRALSIIFAIQCQWEYRKLIEGK